MPDSGAIGPRREQSGDHRPVEGFDAVVASLADGELLIPAVLNLASSLALAGNASTVREINGLIRSLHYRVQVTVLSPDSPELGEREIVNTVAQGMNPLTALLETILDEIAELYERKKGTSDGSQDH